MCDCFPQNGGSIPVSESCRAKTGSSDYAVNFKQWCSPVKSSSFAPETNSSEGGEMWKKRFSFSKGARFGIPPYCDCTPPPERFRFETTYQHDFIPELHKDSSRFVRQPVLPGVSAQQDTFLPPQNLCPFTTDTTYARAFDMPQTHFKQICSQQDSCGGCNNSPCVEDQCTDPGLQIRFSTQKQRPCVPKLKKENLIKPGTDTAYCCNCERVLPCCPCPDGSKLCDACCGCEFPCKLHMAATTPTRRYPIVLNTPRYVPDPRVPPRRPLLLCRGGTLECPLQNQFPTAAAISSAKQKIMDKLEEERCRFPPECIESTYRGSFKTPPLNDAPKYCSKEQREEARKAEEKAATRGLPDKCLADYCLDGGRPPDPRPMFDHLSTYEADFIWENPQRFKLLGGEIPCEFEVKRLCSPKVIHASEVIKQRTEEKERWGEDWLCVPQP